MKDYRIESLPWVEADLSGYRAEIPELSGCSALGRSPEEALAALKLARADWIRRAREERREVPPPILPLEPPPAQTPPVDPRSPEERIGLDPDRLRDFCERWKVREFWLFGSVIREDFGPSSDVDVMVRFEEEARWSLSDLVQMEDELAAWFGRPVDLVEVDAVTNPIRRSHILENRRLLFAAS